MPAAVALFTTFMGNVTINVGITNFQIGMSLYTCLLAPPTLDRTISHTITSKALLAVDDVFQQKNDGRLYTSLNYRNLKQQIIKANNVYGKYFFILLFSGFLINIIFNLSKLSAMGHVEL